MSSALKHITVCICTYKRPKYLAKLLTELSNQKTEQLFKYSVVVVDNDHIQSAASIVEALSGELKIDIDYCVEPEQNISLARNKAVEKAKGDFIAFIDDDEFPINDWLLNLYKAYYKYEVDGVLGPVVPHFDTPPPEWLVKGKFFERKSHKTGTSLHWLETRTGNVLLNRKLLQSEGNKFGLEFGLTGGEDIEFFKKLMSKGFVFVWCNEAVVYETVPPERWEKSFIKKKYIRFGGLGGEKARTWPHKYLLLLKANIAFALYLFLLPFSIIGGHHVFMKNYVKVLYYFAWISGFFGVVLIRHRND